MMPVCRLYMQTKPSEFVLRISSKIATFQREYFDRLSPSFRSSCSGEYPSLGAIITLRLLNRVIILLSRHASMVRTSDTSKRSAFIGDLQELERSLEKLSLPLELLGPQMRAFKAVRRILMEVEGGHVLSAGTLNELYDIHPWLSRTPSLLLVHVLLSKSGNKMPHEVSERFFECTTFASRSSLANQ